MFRRSSTTSWKETHKETIDVDRTAKIDSAEDEQMVTAELKNPNSISSFKINVKSKETSQDSDRTVITEKIDENAISSLSTILEESATAEDEKLPGMNSAEMEELKNAFIRNQQETKNRSIEDIKSLAEAESSLIDKLSGSTITDKATVGSDDSDKKSEESLIFDQPIKTENDKSSETVLNSEETKPGAFVERSEISQPTSSKEDIEKTGSESMRESNENKFDQESLNRSKICENFTDDQTDQPPTKNDQNSSETIETDISIEHKGFKPLEDVLDINLKGNLDLKCHYQGKDDLETVIKNLVKSDQADRESKEMEILKALIDANKEEIKEEKIPPSDILSVNNLEGMLMSNLTEKFVCSDKNEFRLYAQEEEEFLDNLRLTNDLNDGILVYDSETSCSSSSPLLETIASYDIKKDYENILNKPLANINNREKGNIMVNKAKGNVLGDAGNTNEDAKDVDNENIENVLDGDNTTIRNPEDQPAPTNKNNSATKEKKEMEEKEMANKKNHEKRIHESEEKNKKPSNTFVPEKLENPCVDSKILEYRQKNMIKAEGKMWKKRRIFSCFWHQKYFCLLTNGFLLYHKLDGARFAKGDWNVAGMEISKRYAFEEMHPYRLVLPDETYFGFDDQEERDYWYREIEELKEEIKKSPRPEM